MGNLNLPVDLRFGAQTLHAEPKTETYINSPWP